jgi:hypothetical protein
MTKTHIIYNVTISVDKNMTSNWMNWMLNEHLRDMMGTGCFLGFRFCELHTEQDLGPTYTVQYELASQGDLDKYEQNFAPQMRAKGAQLFGEKALAFRSTMTVLAKGELRDQ